MYVPIFLRAGVGILASFLAFHVFRSYWRLKSIPGPFWARLTNLSRVQWVRSPRAHEIHMDLHDQYGNCVRFGPNMVSIADPEAIPTVYPTRPGFIKSDFYKVLMPYTKDGALPLVFNTRDETVHKQLKTPIAPLFSVTNVMSYERFVDTVLGVMCHSLDKHFVQTGKTFDLTDWLRYFAFDVMGTLTFSKPFGFLEQRYDVNGMLEMLWRLMKTTAPVTQITWFDEWWNKNPWVAQFRVPFGNGILGLVGKFVQEGQEQHKIDSKKGKKSEELNDRDMLSRFLEVQASNPSVPPWAVTAWTFSNITAGPDAMSQVLRNVWYNLLSHPSTLATLCTELQEANISRPYPKWYEVRELPYLDACINEALRLYPPFSIPLERVVPKDGVTILGRFFEAGTVVGMSPYVVGRHKRTFGEDAHQWRPERWMGIEKEKHRKMWQSVLAFGAGRRACLEKAVAFLRMKKLVPTLLLNYEINTLGANDYWVDKLRFYRQKGLNVKIKRRAVDPSRRTEQRKEKSTRSRE